MQSNNRSSSLRPNRSPIIGLLSDTARKHFILAFILVHRPIGNNRTDLNISLLLNFFTLSRSQRNTYLLLLGIPPRLEGILLYLC